MTHHLVLPTTSLLLSIASAGLLAACGTPPSPVDQRFGLSVKEAQHNQTLNETDCQGHCEGHKPGMRHARGPDSDGVTARSAITLYQKTFETPSPSAPVFNIGIGSQTTR